MENIEMALPLGGGLIMDEDAASIVAQIKSLLKQLRTKGATDKEIDSLLIEEDKPGRAYIDSAGMLVLPDEGNIRIKLTPMERTLYIPFLRNSLLHNTSDLVPDLASINEDIYFAKGDSFLEIQYFRSEFMIKKGR